MSRRVALLFGGSSVEHEVSVTSARGVREAMRSTELECVPVAVTRSGRWLGPELSRKLLASTRARAEPREGEDDGTAVVIEAGGGPGLRQLRRDGTTRPLEVDLVFPLIHGWGGEDGRLQGALELAGMAYVGSGVLASAVAMDKIVARTLLEAHGIPGVRWLSVRHEDYLDHPALTRVRVAELGYPVFVKPANGGSSVGISRVTGAEGLDNALGSAFGCDRRVIVEQGLDARELECAVLGNASAEASVVGEIVPSNEFYDYRAKYVDAGSQLHIPADIPAQIAETLRSQAVAAFRILDLAGFARIDFLFERGSDRLYLNEANSLPGFTPISMFPRLWEASGLPYSRLIERLCELAVQRSEAGTRRRVTLDEGV